jgi:hypothetical protein
MRPELKRERIASALAGGKIDKKELQKALVGMGKSLKEVPTGVCNGTARSVRIEGGLRPLHLSL